MDALISIIIPVYNVEKYLRRCLDSVIAQTYTNWECLLIDDGSTDSSGAVCDEYAAKDSRFVVVHKQNEGVAKARLDAFEQSSGELVTFIDSDDYVSPVYLEKLSEPIINQGADMVSCNYCRETAGVVKEAPDKLIGAYEGKQLKDFIANHYFYDYSVRGYGMTQFLWTKMIRRKFVKTGLEQGLGLWFGEDQLSMFYMLKQCKKLVLLQDRLYYYVQHEGQATKKYNYSLWENVITLMQRYQSMDTDRIAESGIRLRIWIYMLNNTLKMQKDTSIADCCRHLSQMRETPYMESFFSEQSIGFGFMHNVRYWMLKFRLYWLYSVFYKVLGKLV